VKTHRLSISARLRAHPLGRCIIPKNDAWSLATGQSRSNWGQPTARVCLCCSKVLTKVFSQVISRFTATGATDMSMVPDKHQHQSNQSIWSTKSPSIPPTVSQLLCRSVHLFRAVALLSSKPNQTAKPQCRPSRRHPPDDCHPCPTSNSSRDLNIH